MSCERLKLKNAPERDQFGVARDQWNSHFVSSGDSKSISIGNRVTDFQRGSFKNSLLCYRHNHYGQATDLRQGLFSFDLSFNLTDSIENFTQIYERDK